jgi:hypothetical protein
MDSSAWVYQAGLALGSETRHPTVRTLPRDPHGLRGVSNRPALTDNPIDQQQPAVHGQTSITV